MVRVTAIIVSLLYILFYLLAPNAYELFPHLTRIQAAMQELQYVIPFVLLLPIYFKWILYPFKYISKRDVWLGIFATGMIVCMVLSSLAVPTMWGSWKTYGLMLAAMSFVLIASRNKLTDTQSLYLAVGTIFLVVGSWEIFYNVALIHYYNAFDMAPVSMFTQLTYDVMWVIVGAGVLALIWSYNRNVFKVSKITVIFVIAGLGLFLTWVITTRMWLPVYWSNNDTVLNYTPTRYGVWLLIHGSKVFWYFLIPTLLLHEVHNTKNVPVKEYYTQIEKYDWVTDTKYPEKLFHRMRVNHIKGLVTKYVRGTTTLDLGCGTGLVLKELPGDVYGIDINPWNVERAKQHCPNATVILGDVEAPLPYEANKFNAVVCSDVLEHLEKREQVLQHVLDVLKPGGYFIGEVPSNSLIWKFRELLTTTCPVAEPFHLSFNKHQIREMLRDFQVIYIGASILGMEISFVARKKQS